MAAITALALASNVRTNAQSETNWLLLGLDWENGAGVVVRDMPADIPNVVGRGPCSQHSAHVRQRSGALFRNTLNCPTRRGAVASTFAAHYAIGRLATEDLLMIKDA